MISDFRYLGAHLSTADNCLSSTLRKRLEKAIAQLNRFRCVPATLEGKARAVHAKVFAAALYGIEAAHLPIAKIAKLSIKIIDIFRSRNDDHNVDFFFSSMATDKCELDPMAQILSRRVMQVRRACAKNQDVLKRCKRIIAKYVDDNTNNDVLPSWYHAAEEGDDTRPDE